MGKVSLLSQSYLVPFYSEGLADVLAKAGTSTAAQKQSTYWTELGEQGSNAPKLRAKTTRGSKH